MLPTYEQCNAIAEHNSAFLRKEEVIGETRIVQFNYMLASYQDFAKEYFPGVNAFELRGLTFIRRSDGRWERQLMLHKFFNLNQTFGYMYDDVKDKKILRVQDKKDGSLIRFVRLNDGTVLAKSKFSFQSEQAIEANKIYAADGKFRSLVDWTLDHRIAAMFEFVSPFNRIVLNYAETDLVLIQMRSEETGEYVVNIGEQAYPMLYDWRCKVAAEERQNKTLDEYISWAATAENVEGVVITFDDGHMMKLKTDWYFRMHKLLTEHVNRENVVIAFVLNEQIDDVISQIPLENVEERNMVEEIARLVTNFINNTARKVYDLVDYEYTGNRKRFAVRHNRDDYFGIMMKVIDMGDGQSYEKTAELVKEFVAKNTRTLEQARVFVNTLKRKEEK